MCVCVCVRARVRTRGTGVTLIARKGWGCGQLIRLTPTSRSTSMLLSHLLKLVTSSFELYGVPSLGDGLYKVGSQINDQPPIKGP